MLTHIAPQKKSGMAIVNVSSWGGHVHFYGSDEAGRCERNYATSREANKKPHLQYDELQKGKPVRYQYSSCQFESPFAHEKVPPFDDWRTEGELNDAIENEFDSPGPWEEFASKKRQV